MNTVPFPQVVEHDDRTFYLRTSRYVAGRPTAIRIATEQALADNTVEHFAQIIGYAHRVTIRGRESLPDPVRDSEASFVIDMDATASRRSSLEVAFVEFEEALSRMVAEGTPVRKTDREGSGTAGTRLVEGLGPLGFVLYYDDVARAATAEAG